MVRRIVAVALMAAAGCAGPQPKDPEAELYASLCGEETVEVADGREMLAAALRHQIERYAEKNGTGAGAVFVSVLDLDPADELLARLAGAPLEVRKFSQWSAYYRSRDGRPYIPENYVIISVRSMDIADYDNAAVSTQWNVSGILLPAQTYVLARIAGSWTVTGTRFSSP